THPGEVPEPVRNQRQGVAEPERRGAEAPGIGRDGPAAAPRVLGCEEPAPEAAECIAAKGAVDRGPELERPLIGFQRSVPAGTESPAGGTAPVGEHAVIRKLTVGAPIPAQEVILRGT